MAWPSLSDYSEALQNPRYAFSDIELQNGNVVVNKLGQPRPISGNFATVFQVQSGNRTWAVRCFSREITDQQERYDAISRHLRNYNLPYMVGFKYLPQGIRVAGRWYPIVKMEWMKGLTLDVYIERNLRDGAKLQYIARQWVEVCRSLRSAAIAHGDLQHGNIVITDNNEIKLIDYDGIYIPDLTGKKGYELGHRHYQHPSRTSQNGIMLGNFINIDNFSTWVIATSLMMVQIDPTLWQKTQAGDDNLIFRDVDYKDPARSKTFQLLANHPSDQIRLIARRVLDVVASQSYLQVPTLDKLEAASGRRPTIVGWLSDHLPNSRKSASADSAPGNTLSSAQQSWLLDHMDAEFLPEVQFDEVFIAHERLEFEMEFHRLKLLGNIKLLFPIYVSKRVYEKFSTYPVVIEKMQAEKIYRALTEQKKQADRALVLATQTLNQTRQQMETTLRSKESEVQGMWQAIDESANYESADIDAVVEYDRQQYVIEQLNEYTIKPKRPAGIGRKRVEALKEVGISTAADIHEGNEENAFIALAAVANASPEDDWQKLQEWRLELESTIDYPIPQYLPEIVEIRSNYTNWRREQTSKMLELKTIAEKLAAQTEAEIYKLAVDQREKQQRAEQLTALAEQADHRARRYQQITQFNLIERILRT